MYILRLEILLTVAFACECCLAGSYISELSNPPDLRTKRSIVMQMAAITAKGILGDDTNSGFASLSFF